MLVLAGALLVTIIITSSEARKQKSYEALETELNALEAQRLSAQNAATPDVDKRIASLKAELAPLEAAHKAAVEEERQIAEA